MFNSSRIAAAVRFRDLELDAARRELRRDGEVVKLEPKVFDLLEYLVRHRDRRVSKQELLDELWSGADVAESSLASALARLRRRLGPARDAIHSGYRTGYQFVGVCEPVDTARRPVDGTLLVPAFVGREEELRQLEAIVARARQGHGAIVVLSGEQGIGKSRLSDELFARSADGVERVIGRCHEGDAMPPFWPWVQLLRAYGFAANAAALARATAASGPALASLLPDLAPPTMRPTPNTTGNDGASARRELFRAVVAFLRAASSRRPLLILIEDLHWADAASLSLLRFVASQLSGMPVALVITGRPSTAESPAPLLACLEFLRSLDWCTDLPLPGLSDLGASEMIRAIGIDLDARVEAEIRLGANGNPFFLEQLARHFSDRPAEAPHRLPPTLQFVLEQRLASLTPATRHVLAVASVVGIQFDIELVKSLVARELGDQSSRLGERVADALDEARSARIVERVADDRGRFHFTHALWREAVYRGQGATDRIRRHQRAGEVLEAQVSFDVAEVAEHYWIGATGTPTRKAIEWLRRAGEAAAARFAFEAAAQRFEQAISLAAFVDDFPRRSEGYLGTLLARAQWSLGALSAATASVDRAVAIARELGDGELMARAALAGEVPVAQADSNPALIALIDEALERLPRADSALRIGLLGRAAWAHYYDGDGGAERRRLSAESVASARRLNDPVVLVTALAQRHRALMDPDHPEERLALAREVVASATAQDSPEMRAAGLQALAWDLAERGQMGEADEAMREHGEIADRTHRSVDQWVNLLWRGMRVLLQGDWDEAARMGQQTFDFGKSLDAPYANLSFASQYLSKQVMQGNLDGLAVQLEAMIPAFPRLSGLTAALAYVRARDGDADRARAAVDTCLAGGVENLAWDTTWLPTLGLIASAYALIGDVSGCSWLYELVAKYADRVVLLGLNATVCYGSGARTVAALATTIGRWREADDLFEQAVSVNRAIGARPWLAYTLGEHAQMLDRRGRKRDHSRAAARRHEAIELARALGIKVEYVIGSDPA